MRMSNQQFQQQQQTRGQQDNQYLDYDNDGQQEDTNSNRIDIFKNPISQNNKSNSNLGQSINNNNNNNQGYKNYREINTKQNLKQRLKIIFTFYCSYGDRTNTTILKSNKFRKLMLEANMIDAQINQKYIDLLYTQYTQNKVQMDFNNFCNILSRISAEKYQSIHPSQALLKVIDVHLGSIYQNIMTETELGKDLSLFDVPIHPDCIIAAKSLYHIFKRIYFAYFSWEPTNSFKQADNFKQSMNGLFSFLKDYDIFPNLLTKSTSFLLYDQLVENTQQSLISNGSQGGLQQQQQQQQNQKMLQPFGYEDIGKLFTLNRFITFIIKASQICFSKVPEAKQYSMEHPIQKFIALLERMELSEGFLNFEKKIHSTHNSTTSLLIPVKAIQEIVQQNQKLDPNQLGFQHSMQTPKKDIKIRFTNESLEKNQNGNSPDSLFEDTQQGMTSPSMNRRLFLLQSLDIDERAFEIFEQKSSELQYIFITFCQYGEPCNTQYLKTIKLVKLLKSAGIMRKRDENNNQHSPQRNSTTTKRFGRKYLDQTFLDCLIAKLVGPNQVRQFTNKLSEYDRMINSPNIGFLSHQSNKTDNNGSKGKLEYEHFLKILQEIAFELLPDQDIYDSLNILINDFILKAKIDDPKINNRRTSEEYIALHNEISQHKDILCLLEDIHPSLSNYFIRYSYPRETKMNLDQFLQFCKDFDVFPNLMPKSQLHYIFTALSFIYKQQICQQNESKSISLYHKSYDNDDGKEFIDSFLFTEAIALCAIEVYTIETNPVNQILLLLERMNSSNGPKIMLKSLGLTSTQNTQWDLLGDARKKYQHFYEEKLLTRNKTSGRLNTNNDENTFENLLDLGFSNYMQNGNNFNYQ